MPKVKITDNVTGEVAVIDWAGDKPPTPLEARNYITKQLETKVAKEQEVAATRTRVNPPTPSQLPPDQSKVPWPQNSFIGGPYGEPHRQVGLAVAHAFDPLTWYKGAKQAVTSGAALLSGPKPESIERHKRENTPVLTRMGEVVQEKAGHLADTASGAMAAAAPFALAAAPVAMAKALPVFMGLEYGTRKLESKVGIDPETGIGKLLPLTVGAVAASPFALKAAGKLGKVVAPSTAAPSPQASAVAPTVVPPPTTPKVSKFKPAAPVAPPTTPVATPVTPPVAPPAPLAAKPITQKQVQKIYITAREQGIPTDAVHTHVGKASLKELTSTEASKLINDLTSGKVIKPVALPIAPQPAVATPAVPPPVSPQVATGPTPEVLVPPPSAVTQPLVSGLEPPAPISVAQQALRRIRKGKEAVPLVEKPIPEKANEPSRVVVGDKAELRAVEPIKPSEPIVPPPLPSERSLTEQTPSVAQQALARIKKALPVVKAAEVPAQPVVKIPPVSVVPPVTTPPVAKTPPAPKAIPPTIKFPGQVGVSQRIAKLQNEFTDLRAEGDNPYRMEQIQKEIKRLRKQEVTGIGPVRPPIKAGERGLLSPKPVGSREPEYALTDTGKVKLGADVESLGRILGSSLYSKGGPQVVTKELLQNAYDAIRLVPEGEVKAHVDPHRRTITIEDNGRGMTRAEVETVFTDLGSSGKRGEVSASGGFGLAKAAPLMMSEKVHLVTTANTPKGRFRTTMEATPEDLLGEGVSIKHELVELDVPTGTRVEVTMPSKYTPYDLSKASNEIRQSQRSIKAPGKLHGTEQSGYSLEATDITSKDTTLLDRPIYTGRIADSTVDLQIVASTTKNPELLTKGLVEVEVNNNGIYQFSHHVYTGGSKAKGIPTRLAVDIKALVPEGHPEYPFTANREALRGKTLEIVESIIKKEVIDPANREARNYLQKQYDTMPTMTLASGRKVPFHDAGERLTVAEKALLKINDDFQNLAETFVRVAEGARDVAKSSNILGPSGITGVGEGTERIGLILSDRVYGVNVPNPGSSPLVSTVLFNPFQFQPKSSPSQIASLYWQTIKHELLHDKVSDHYDTFTTGEVKLSEALGELDIKSLEILRDAYGGQTSTLRPGIKSALHIYKESRGRAANAPDLFGGEASRTERPLVKPGGTKEDIGGLRPSGETSIKTSRPDKSGERGAVKGDVLRLVIDALKAARPIREVQEFLYSKERGMRFARAESVKARGETGFHKELGLLKGPLPKAQFESIRDKVKPHHINQLFTMIRNTPNLTYLEKFPAREGLSKLFGEFGGSVPQRGELALLERAFSIPREVESPRVSLGRTIRVYPPEKPGASRPVSKDIGREFVEAMLEKRPFLVRMKEAGFELANIPRALMSSYDLSAALRQGLFLIGRPKQWLPAFRGMFRAFGSENASKTIQDTIRQNPNYELMQKSKLALTEIGEELSMREEAFMSSWAEKIPLIGRGVHASNRAYLGFLNKLRADVFNDLFAKAEKSGLNPADNLELTKEIADYINTATGRGELPTSLQGAATAINSVFFSPKLMASRIKLLNPAYYVQLPKFVRQQALRDLFSSAGVVFTITSLAKLAGADVEIDPRSADFGKIKFGNTRMDVAGGFLQYIRLASQLLTNTTVTGAGKVRPLGEGYKPTTRLDVLGRFVATKEAPVASFVTDWMRGTTLFGEKFDLPKAVGQRFVPMAMQDIYDIAKDDPELLPLAVPGIFGVGVQTYTTPQPAGKSRGLRTTLPGLPVGARRSLPSVFAP